MNPIEAEIARRESLNAKKSLKSFVKYFWSEIVPNDLIWSPHMDVLCDEIQKVHTLAIERKPKDYDLIINVPPGTSKTLICSVFATCWAFARKPSVKIFVGSYSDKAVLNIADSISLLMNSEKYMESFPEVKIRKNANTKHAFKTVQRGEFFAYTIGGALTGKHADILVLDDPINPKGAASKAELKKANDFIDKTLPTRKTDKKVTPTVLIMQRLSHDDPTAHLLNKKGDEIRHICLPAKLNLATTVEYQTIYTDSILDPNRLDQDALDDLKTDLGDWGYNAQILQQPTPPGGSTFKRSWFQFSDLDPAHFRQAINLYIDGAYTKKKKNDPSAIAVYFKFRGIVYLVDCFSVRVVFPELQEIIKDTLVKYGHPTVSKVYVEGKGPGKSLVQSFEASNPYMNIKEDLIPHIDKESRASGASKFVQNGSFQLLRGDWNAEYLKEILEFPYGKHDDRVDCTSAIIRIELYNGQGFMMSKA